MPFLRKPNSRDGTPSPTGSSSSSSNSGGGALRPLVPPHQDAVKESHFFPPATSSNPLLPKLADPPSAAPDPIAKAPAVWAGKPLADISNKDPSAAAAAASHPPKTAAPAAPTAPAAPKPVAAAAKPIPQGVSQQPRRPAAAGTSSHHRLPQFTATLRECGIRFENGTPAALVVEPTEFRHKLQKRLVMGDSHGQGLDDFLDGMAEYLSDLARFQSGLHSLQSSQDSSKRLIQESLIRILLGVDSVQPALVTILLEKLPEVQDDSELSRDAGNNLPRLIMSQMRWLDHIVEGRQLADKLIEVLSVTNPDVQREIIACLPDILNDADHKRVVENLSGLLSSSSQLMVPILDALSNLNLQASQMDEVRDKIIKLLPSVEVTDLPVVVRFIQQFVTADNAFAVIEKLRRELDFHSLALSSDSVALRRAAQASSSSASVNGETLTLDAIRSGLRFQKIVADGWVKVLQSLDSTAEEHRAIDVFVALMLFGIAPSRKTAEALIRKKVKQSKFTLALLRKVFQHHSQAILSYFRELLTLAEILLRSADSLSRSFAACIYRNCFTTFDTFSRQEVVGALVTHVGAGVSVCADSALDVLCDLALCDGARLAEFTVFVKNTLDYLDQLSLSQIRKIFALLSLLSLARRDASGDSGASASSSSSTYHHRQPERLVDDDVNIILRKQLFSPNGKFKRIGIIGILTSIEYGLGVPRSSMLPDAALTSRYGKGKAIMSESSHAASRAPPSAELVKEAENLLSFVRKSCKTPDCVAFYYDELSRMFLSAKMDVRIEEAIAQEISENLTDDYMRDVNEMEEDVRFCTAELTKLCQLSGAQSPFALPVRMDAFYNLDASAATIGFEIIRFLAAKDSSKRDSVVTLGSNVKLLQVCQRQLNGGSLSQIDALLGCPIYLLSPEETLEKFAQLPSAVREVFCLSLLHTCNWFIELINAFSTQSETEVQLKLLHRIHHLYLLRDFFVRALPHVARFAVPMAVFEYAELLAVDLADSSLGKRRAASKSTAPSSSKGSSGVSSETEGIAEARHTAAAASDNDEAATAGARNTDEEEGEGGEGEDGGAAATSKKRSRKPSTSLPPNKPLLAGGESNIDPYARQQLSLRALRGCFRELELEAFAILKFGRKYTHAIASQTPPPAIPADLFSDAQEVPVLAQVPPFSILHVRLLLDDLAKKLKFRLESPSTGGLAALSSGSGSGSSINSNSRTYLPGSGLGAAPASGPPSASARAFPASAKKKPAQASAFLSLARHSTATVVSAFLDLLPHLCLHLEDVVMICSEHFQMPSLAELQKRALKEKAKASSVSLDGGDAASADDAAINAADDNDDGLSESGRDHAIPIHAAACLDLILQCFVSFLHWEGLHDHTGNVSSQQLRLFLATLAGRRARVIASIAKGRSNSKAATKLAASSLSLSSSSSSSSTSSSSCSAADAASAPSPAAMAALASDDAGLLTTSNAAQLPFPELAASAFSYLASLWEAVPSLPTAATLLKLLDLVATRTVQANLSPVLSEIAERFLMRREWYVSHIDTASASFASAASSSSLPSSSSSAASSLGVISATARATSISSSHPSEAVSVLATLFIQKSDDPVGVIESNILVAMDSLVARGGHSAPSSALGAKSAETHGVPFLPLLSKKTLPSFYKAAMDGATLALKELAVFRERGVACPEGSPEAHLIKLKHCIHVFKSLIDILKEFDQRLILLAAVKNGKQFIETFLRVGMPFFDAHFLEYKDTCSNILKSFQLATRALQSVCGHGKVIRDASITAHVPALRKALETVVFRAKAMFAMNNVGTAFNIGILKHKTIRGEVISSQGYDHGYGGSGSDSVSEYEEEAQPKRAAKAKPKLALRAGGASSKEASDQIVEGVVSAMLARMSQKRKLDAQDGEQDEPGGGEEDDDDGRERQDDAPEDKDKDKSNDGGENDGSDDAEDGERRSSRKKHKKKKDKKEKQHRSSKRHGKHSSKRSRHEDEEGDSPSPDDDAEDAEAESSRSSHKRRHHVDEAASDNEDNENDDEDEDDEENNHGGEEEEARASSKKKSKRTRVDHSDDSNVEAHSADGNESGDEIFSE